MENHLGVIGIGYQLPLILLVLPILTTVAIRTAMPGGRTGLIALLAIGELALFLLSARVFHIPVDLALFPPMLLAAILYRWCFHRSGPGPKGPLSKLRRALKVLLFVALYPASQIAWIILFAGGA